MTVRSTSDANWISVSCDGSIGNGGSRAATLTLVPSRVDELPPGTHQAIVEIIDTEDSTVLTSIPVSLTLTSVGGPNISREPTGNLISSGEQGGPFSPAFRYFTLNNSGTTPLNVTTTVSANWVEVTDFGSGDLPAGGSNDLFVRIVDSQAANLPQGTHTATVQFLDDQNQPVVNSVSVTLNVTAPAAPNVSRSPTGGINAAGLLGGPYTPGSRTFTLSNTGNAGTTVSSTVSANWVEVSGLGSGTLNAGGSLDATISLVNSELASLPAGSYQATVQFLDPQNQPVVSAVSVSLTLSEPSTNDDGFTTFDPPAGARVIYVSATGSDSNDGLSESSPRRSLAAGIALLRDGQPDHLLLKRGDTWQDSFGDWSRSGRSPTEPMVISTYGDPSLPRPLVQTGSGDGFGAYSTSQSRLRNVALMGIHFQANGYNGGNGSPIAIRLFRLFDSLLIEDCFVEGYYQGTVVQGANGFHTNVVFRRNVVVDNYTTQAIHALGSYFDYTDGLLLEENVWDHNGWSETVPGADGTIFRHNVYVQTNCRNVTIRRNIAARAASHGIQLRPGGVARDNVFLRNSHNLLVGSSWTGGAPNGTYGEVVGNVCLDGKNITSSLPRGTGIDLQNITSGEVRYNIMAHLRNGGFPKPMSWDGNVGSGIRNIPVTDNVIYNWGAALRASGRLEAITFSRNRIFEPNTGSSVFSLGSSIPGAVFSNNSYGSSASSGSWFVHPSGALSFDGWRSQMGESGSTAGSDNFPRPSSDIESYHASIGGGSSLDSFMSEARRQRRGFWRGPYTTQAVLDYIREGFGVNPQ